VGHAVFSNLGHVSKKVEKHCFRSCHTKRCHMAHRHKTNKKYSVAVLAACRCT